MHDPNDPDHHPDGVLAGSIRNIAAAAVAHRDLLRCARHLRLMTAHSQAASALAALLLVRPLEEMRLSWGILGSICAGGTAAVAAAYLAHAGTHELSLITWSIFGVSPDDALRANEPSRTE